MPSAAEEMAEHCASHWGPLAVRLPWMQPLLIKSHPRAKRWLGFAGMAKWSVAGSWATWTALPESFSGAE